MYCAYYTPLRHQVPEQWNHIEYWYNTMNSGIKCFVIHELTVGVLREMFHDQHLKWLLAQEATPITNVAASVIYVASPSSDNPLIPMFNTTIQETVK
jgi:hypothetical protein